MQVLAHQGFGGATFNFSTQPFSVSTLNKGESPFFRRKNPKLQDLAAEVEAVANLLREKGFANIIPVSLSYSGAVSAHLKGFPLVLETVPMTSTAATNPQLEKFRQTLKAGELFNPIFGPGITRSLLDQAYRKQWTQQTEAITKQFNLPADRKEDMIEGYTSMSRAAEGFDWKDVRLDSKTRRVFVLAGNEAPTLLRNQIQTFQRLMSERNDALMFLVLESGHVVPAEQPIAYASLIRLLVTNKIGISSGVVIVKPSTGEIQATTGADATKTLEKILEQLPKDSDQAADLTGG
jgi:pimeloyl-ACP methyl ester carboxylesterase